MGALLIWSRVRSMYGLSAIGITHTSVMGPRRASGGGPNRLGLGASPAPPVCYLERAASTTLRIKVPKANIAPRVMHKSAMDIGIFP